MSTYSNRLHPALRNLLQRVVRFFHLRSSCPTHISADVCGGRKSLVEWHGTIYRVVRFFHPWSSCTTTHILADVQRITLNVSCMTISRERNEQLYIFCRVTGITSDFLSFIDVVLIRFFHRALHMTSCKCSTALIMIMIMYRFQETVRYWPTTAYFPPPIQGVTPRIFVVAFGLKNQND